MPQAKEPWVPTIDSVRVLKDTPDPQAHSEAADKLPAPVDLMILRALLAQPILTAAERDAAARKAAGKQESFPLSIR
jgi:hypothetical protein